MTLSKQQRHNDLDRYWMETVRLHSAMCIFIEQQPIVMAMRFIIGHTLCIMQLLCLVGESFDEASEDVCGAVVNVRPKGDKIAIWTSTCQNRDAIMTIG